MSYAIKLFAFWDELAKEGGSFPAKIAGAFLFPASCFYLAGVSACRRLSGRARLPCPVISVGNITAGGTGKTPAVETLCRMLMEMGLRPAAVSRGYMGSRSLKISVVSDGSSVLLGPEEAGDEPVMLAETLPGVPVLTGRNRYEAGRIAHEKYGAGIVVLDDGFQYYALGRDLEIVVLDSTSPLGNGFLLPRGPLRELPSRLGEADLLILTRTDLCPDIDRVKDMLSSVSRGKPVLESIHEPVLFRCFKTGEEKPAGAFRGKKGLVFSGIGNSRGFEKSVSNLGITIVRTLRFPDHYPYSARDLGRIAEEFERSGAECIITTAKDSVRLRARAEDVPESVHALVVRLKVTGGGEYLEKALEGLLRPKKAGDGR